MKQSDKHTETLEGLIGRYLSEYGEIFGGLLKIDVNTKGRDGVTPLHLAIMRRAEDDVRLLIEGGADVNAQDSSGSSPLSSAVAADNLEIASMLIDAGADPQAKPERTFHFANETLEQLLGRYALESTYSFGGLTQIFVNSIGRELETPLHMAVTRGELDDVTLLLSGGANVHARDMLGATPLHRAVSSAKLDIIRTLLDAGADPDCSTEFGETPLSRAEKRGVEDVIELLVRYSKRNC